MNKHRLRRQIDRIKKKMSDLEEKEAEGRLSNHGYWLLGYFKGKLSVMEDWLDEIEENEIKEINK
jgi:hypothetical protein